MKLSFYRTGNKDYFHHFFILLDVAVIFLAGIIVETIRIRLAALFSSNQNK